MKVRPCDTAATMYIIPRPYCNPATGQHISMRKVMSNTMVATPPVVKAITPISCATWK